MEKVAVYLTFKKKHDNRIKDIQMKNISDYCFNKNYDYDLYLDIVDSNLDLFHRKDFNRLKEQIEDDKYDKVIIKNMSNLSRDNLFCIDFIKFLKNNNCLIECVDDTEVNYKVYDEISRLMNQIEKQKLEREGKVK